jgi:hypothetical protein
MRGTDDVGAFDYYPSSDCHKWLVASAKRIEWYPLPALSLRDYGASAFFYSGLKPPSAVELVSIRVVINAIARTCADLVIVK